MPDGRGRGNASFWQGRALLKVMLPGASGVAAISMLTVAELEFELPVGRRKVEGGCSTPAQIARWPEDQPSGIELCQGDHLRTRDRLVSLEDAVLVSVVEQLPASCRAHRDALDSIAIVRIAGSEVRAREPVVGIFRRLNRRGSDDRRIERFRHQNIQRLRRKRSAVGAVSADDRHLQRDAADEI